MNIRIVWPTLALLALDGCALLDLPPEPPAAHATAARLVLDPLLVRRNASAGVISVHRDVESASDSCRHRVYLDGNAVADLRSNEFVNIYAQPGAHRLRVEPNGTGCNGGAFEIVAVAEQGASQSFKTAAASGSLLISAAE